MIFVFYVIACVLWGFHSVYMQRKYYENHQLNHCLVIFALNTMLMPFCFVIALYNRNILSVKNNKIKA